MTDPADPVAAVRVPRLLSLRTGVKGDCINCHVEDVANYWDATGNVGPLCDGCAHVLAEHFAPLVAPAGVPEPHARVVSMDARSRLIADFVLAIDFETKNLKLEPALAAIDRFQEEPSAVGRLPALPQSETVKDWTSGYKAAYEQEKAWREHCEKARRDEAEYLQNHCLTFGEVAGFITSWTLATPESYAQRTPREVALYQLWITLKQRIERAADELVVLRSAGRLPALEALLVQDILEEYRDEVTVGACDRCEDCGPMVMCSFHSVLSLLQGHTLTNAAIARLHGVAGLRADPAPRQLLEEKDDQARVAPLKAGADGQDLSHRSQPGAVTAAERTDHDVE